MRGVGKRGCAGRGQDHLSEVGKTVAKHRHDRRLTVCAVRRKGGENNVTVFTALETVKVLLDVLEEITFGVSTIDAK